MTADFSCSSPEAFIQLPPETYTVFGKEKLPIDEDGYLHWHLVNFGKDIPPAHQVGLLAKAFNEWQQHLFPWVFKSTSSADKAQWKIYFADKNQIELPSGEVIKSPFDFKAAPNTLAVQYAWYPGFEWSLSMIINDDHNLGMHKAGQSFDILKILIHELGHGLRLGHSQATNKGEIMLPFYDPANEITEDSIKGLMAIHGAHLIEYADTLPRSKRFINMYLAKSKKARTRKRRWWRWWR